jgi:polyisoprenoid-binding protein YceI
MPDAGTISLDRESLRVTFVVHWFGILSVRGTFDDVRGHVDLSNERATAEVSITASSVRTGIGLRDRHLARPRFLDAPSHPVITFRGAARLRGEGAPDVSGVVTLRGRDVRLGGVPIRILGREEPRARWSVDFEVPRRAHGIGVASGLARFNPLLWAIGAMVRVRVVALLPATALRTPAAALAPGP